MDPLKIGVYICNCGTNIGKMVDCEALRAYAADLPGVAMARSYKYMCSNPGQELFVRDIRELGLNRIVVCSCSPRMHERTFRGALSTAGLNPFLLEIANIREQCSWVHTDGAAATAKAKALTHAAVGRVGHHQPLENLTAGMNPVSLVIGGGIAGLTAALELAEAGQRVYLVEQTDRLGGNLNRVDLTAPLLTAARDMITTRIARVKGNPRITVLMGSEATSVKGFVGNFEAVVTPLDGSPPRDISIGNVVVATGFTEFDAGRVAEYGYGRIPDVITSFELEAMLKLGRIETSSGTIPRHVTIIHCVGSRSREFNGYCSRVCCMAALKCSHEIRSALPGSKVTDLYMDMNAFGKGCEELYRLTAETGTVFLMFGKDEHPVVKRAGPRDTTPMLVELHEKLSGEVVELTSDLVVLMVGMEARPDAERIAHLVNISRDRDGWFIESHPKLDPVATTTEGIFIAGACSSPKDIPDSVSQARAATARILGKIAKGRIEIEPIFAEIDDGLCSGCRICNGLCPYSAIVFDERTKRSRVESALCKACGACVATCPSGAISGRHFTDVQIFAEIEGVLS